MKQFHNLGKEWSCTRCYKKFDREIDFLKHFSLEHPGHKPGPLTDIVTLLLPKQVFACGFHNCENLSESWEQWFNHITSHMAAGMIPAQWSDSVVISNLLRQNALRPSWDYLLYRYHGASRPSLHWQPPSARVLCQKLECQDFRPGIQFLVQAAYRLGQFGSTPIDSLPGKFLQSGLDTPTCDSVPEYRNNHHLDEILMRNPPDNSLLQSPISNYLATMIRSPTNLDLNPFELMTEQSTFIHQSGEMRNFNGVTLPGYATEQPQPLPNFSGMDLDGSGSDLSRSGFLPNTVAQPSITHDSMDVEPSHILQKFNYFDFPGFVKEHSHRPQTPARLLRRAKSSISLSSKKSRSSPEVEHTPVPVVPPIPPTETGHSGRPRSSSQRSKLSRKSQHQHMA